MPLTLGVALSGCTLQEASPEASASPAPVMAAPPTSETTVPGNSTPPAAPVAGAPGGGMAPPMMSGGMPDPMAPLSPTPDMDKEVVDANKSGDKKKVAAAYTKRGLFRMKDPKAGARLKYRASLSDLRKALAAEPGNSEAQAAKQQIEDIYAQLGRPVPTEDVP